MRTPKTAAIVALALLAATAAACSSSKSNSGSGSSSGKTLTYWASNQGSSLADDQSILKPELDKFTAQTGIKVNLEVIGWPDLLNRITAAVTSGQGPDVLNIGNTWSASLQATGAFQPFDDATLSKVGGKSKFVSSALAATGVQGQPPVAVPLYSEAYGLFYNKKLFAAAGIANPPTTWDELVADGKKLTHGSQWGLALEAGSATENSHHAFILGEQHGAQLFDSAGKPQFSSDQEVAAVKQYIDLMAVDKIVNPSDAENAQNQSITEFADGKAAMLMWQTAGATLAKDGMSTDDYGVVPIPFPADGSGNHVDSFVAGINLAVFKNTKNMDAALKFVNFMTSNTEQTILNKTYGSLPAITSAYSDPAFQTTSMKAFQSVLANSAVPLPAVSGESQFETLVGGAMKTLFAEAASGKPPSDADIKSKLDQADQQLVASSG